MKPVSWTPLAFEFDGKPVRGVHGRDGVWWVGRDVVGGLGDPSDELRIRLAGVSQKCALLLRDGNRMQAETVIRDDALIRVLGEEGKAFLEWTLLVCRQLANRPADQGSVVNAEPTRISPSALVFNYGSQPVRVTLDEAGRPWLVVTDVAEALTHRLIGVDMAWLLDEQDQGWATLETPGGNQVRRVVRLDAMCDPARLAQEPYGEVFSRWLAKEVLPRVKLEAGRGLVAQESDGSALFLFGDLPVRVALGEDGEPWFVAADVCDGLGIDNHRNVLARLDGDEKDVHRMDTLGGPQEFAVINESGLYHAIFTSNKPMAQQFRRWVTHEVLPTIRRTGSYSVPGDKPRILPLDQRPHKEMK